MSRIPNPPPPETIRAARKAAGVTQTAAASLVYVALRGWQKWEAGHHAMPPGLFELFCIKTGQAGRFSALPHLPQ